MWCTDGSSTDHRTLHSAHATARDAAPNTAPSRRRGSAPSLSVRPRIGSELPHVPRAPRRVLPVQVVVAVAQRILDPVQLAKAMHLAICSARLSRGGARGDAAVRGQCRAIIRLGYQLELHVHGIGIAARVAASSHNGRIATAIYAALAAHLDRQLLRPRRRLKCGWTAAAKHAAPYEQQGSHDEEEAGRSPQSSKEQRRAE